MPNKKSHRVELRNAVQNKGVRTFTRSRVAIARKEIADEQSTEQRHEAVQVAVKALDKAVAKGVIHKNNAARRKSRLVKRFNATTSA